MHFANAISLNSPKPEELSLVKGCLQGIREYQERLYHTYASKMFGVCLRYAQDYHSAEDILQEGFVKVFQNLDRYRGEGSLEGWIKRIFINTSIEFYRKQFRFDAEKENLQYLSVVDNNEENGNDNLNTEDLLSFVQKLSPGYRTVFNMYVLEGYSHKEISDLLNISEGTSKSQLARARLLLQKMISDSRV